MYAPAQVCVCVCVWLENNAAENVLQIIKPDKYLQHGPLLKVVTHTHTHTHTNMLQQEDLNRCIHAEFPEACVGFDSGHLRGVVIVPVSSFFLIM